MIKNQVLHGAVSFAILLDTLKQKERKRRCCHDPAEIPSVAVMMRAKPAHAAIFERTSQPTADIAEQPFPRIPCANRRQAGSCPECGSTVHYETDKKSVWQCADCDTKFKAPKITEEAVNE